MVIYEPFPTIPLTELHEELRFEYPDLPNQLFDYYLLRTAVDMAERGNLLRRRLAIELEPGVTRYALRSPDDLRIHAILGVYHSPCSDLFCGGHKHPVDLSPPGGAMCCALGQHVWWDKYEKVLHVNLCMGGVLYVILAVVPDRKACELPQVYKEEFLETLLLGTRSAIMLITGRKWTNLRLGASLRQEYLAAVQALSVEQGVHQLRGTVKINFGRAL